MGRSTKNKKTASKKGKLLSAQELAGEWGVTPTDIERWRQCGWITGQSVGKAWRYDSTQAKLEFQQNWMPPISSSSSPKGRGKRLKFKSDKGKPKPRLNYEVGKAHVMWVLQQDPHHGVSRGNIEFGTELHGCQTRAFCRALEREGFVIHEGEGRGCLYYLTEKGTGYPAKRLGEGLFLARSSTSLKPSSSERSAYDCIEELEEFLKAKQQTNVAEILEHLGLSRVAGDSVQELLTELGWHFSSGAWMRHPPLKPPSQQTTAQRVELMAQAMRKGLWTRRKLVEHLGFTAAEVTVALQRLMTQGQVHEVGQGKAAMYFWQE